MNRQFSEAVSDTGKANLAMLADSGTDAESYANALYALGQELGEVLARQIALHSETVCVACTVEDADCLVKGLIDALSGWSCPISLACFWNQRQETPAFSIAPIIRKYREPDVSRASVLVIVKSVIASACVVKTNLTNLIQDIAPQHIFIVSPVLHTQAPEQLSKEFPAAIAEKFRYIYFAMDDERQANGDLLPGVGGNVYQRLGFKNQDDKNRFTPQLVKDRRALLAPA